MLLATVWKTVSQSFQVVIYLWLLFIITIIIIYDYYFIIIIIYDYYFIIQFIFFPIAALEWRILQLPRGVVEFLDYLTSKLDERHTDKQAYLIKSVPFYDLSITLFMFESITNDFHFYLCLIFSFLLIVQIPRSSSVVGVWNPAEDSVPVQPITVGTSGWRHSRRWRKADLHFIRLACVIVIVNHRHRCRHHLDIHSLGKLCLEGPSVYTLQTQYSNRHHLFLKCPYVPR